MKDMIEVILVVDGLLDCVQIVELEFDMFEGGFNICFGDMFYVQEVWMIDYKCFVVEVFFYVNKMDKCMWGKSGVKIGFVVVGKNWLDLIYVMFLLGIDEVEVECLGIIIYKVGQVFLLDMKGFYDWVEGFDLIVIVEEKCKLIEVQVKEVIFDDCCGCWVYGWYKGGVGQMYCEELFLMWDVLNLIMIV